MLSHSSSTGINQGLTPPGNGLPAQRTKGPGPGVLEDNDAVAATWEFHLCFGLNVDIP